MYGSQGSGGQSSQGGWGASPQGGGFGGQSGSHQGGPGTQQQRSQRNRGPKGYTRSDERIREDISEQLMRHHYIDASEVEIQVQGGEVTLSGTVHERRMKHEVEDLVDNVSGVRDVTNNIRVQRQDQHAGHQSTWMQQSESGLGEQGGQRGSIGQQGSTGSAVASQAGTGTSTSGQAATSSAGRTAGGEQDKDKDAESRGKARGGSTGS
jgi:hypothetical protein